MSPASRRGLVPFLLQEYRFEPDELRHDLGSAVTSLRPAVFDRHAATLVPAEFAESRNALAAAHWLWAAGDETKT